MKPIPGQLDALDLLTAPRAGLTGYKNPCPACGETSPTEFMANLNHGLIPHLEQALGYPVCCSMSLTLNHVRWAIGCVLKVLRGEVVQCCYTSHDLHGRAVKRATIDQVAEHLRHRIDTTRARWGIQAVGFDAILGPALVDAGVFKYALDPAEYPWEHEVAAR